MKLHFFFFRKLYFHTHSCYFHTISVEITKIEMKYHSNFCYFHTNGVEITYWGVEITPPLFLVHYVFQAVNQLCSHFEAYRDIPKITELREKFKNIKQILKSHVFSDFSR
jgi:hypothetical protein